jgi:hypothetical protein
MHKLKSKNNRVFKGCGIISGILILIVSSIFLFFFLCPEYLYNDKLDQILGLKHVTIKKKNIGYWDGVGEWYNCERYILDKKDIDLFLKGNKNNLFPLKENWVKYDWDKLPVKKEFEEAVLMVTTNSDTKTIDKMTKEMNETLLSNNGYYSLFCYSSLKDTQKLVFFLLDEKTNCLFIVDLNYY